MRTLRFLCLLLVFHLNGFTQNLYNGSFEINTAGVCSPALYNSQFNAAMSYVKAFGNFDNGANTPPGKTSIQDSVCSVVPQDGEWCVGIRGNFGQTADAISLELDATLDSATTYYVSFYCYGNVSFHNFDCDLEVGASTSKFSFGTSYYYTTANYLVWKKCSFSFVAQDTSRYITVRAIPGYNSWIQLDNFVISKTPDPLGIQDYMADNTLRTYPNPVRDNLTVAVNTPGEDTKLELYNNLNLPVLQRVIQSPTQELDLSALSEGVYMLRVSNKKTSRCKKIIVAR